MTQSPGKVRMWWIKETDYSYPFFESEICNSIKEKELASDFDVSVHVLEADPVLKMLKEARDAIDSSLDWISSEPMDSESILIDSLARLDQFIKEIEVLNEKEV